MRFILAAIFPVAIFGVVVLGEWLWQHGSTTVAAAVRFELRLAEEQPLPGLIVAQLPDSGGLIYLHQEVLASNDDVAHSWVAPDGPDGVEVVVQFMPLAAQRLQEATGKHIARRVAILIDGTVVMAPVVRSPMADSAVISGTYTKAEAERIARGIEIR
jgi:preprotein translocase subunit SecD